MLGYKSRVLKVDPADVEKFEAAVMDKKTKMYNSKDGTPRWITFRILKDQKCQSISTSTRHNFSRRT